MSDSLNQIIDVGAVVLIIMVLTLISNGVVYLFKYRKMQKLERRTKKVLEDTSTYALIIFCETVAKNQINDQIENDLYLKMYAELILLERLEDLEKESNENNNLELQNIRDYFDSTSI